MIRRLTLVGAVAALAVSGLVTAEPVRALARGAECNVSGSATISPGLGVKATTQSVTLSNVRLTGCRVGSLDAPGVPTTITGNVTVTPNPSTSKAGCANGSLKNLRGVIAWSTGRSTTVMFSTQSVTGETVITGNVVSSTEPSLRPGDLVAGDVVFQPTTTKQNCAKTPVTAVTFQGVVAAGSPK